MPLQAAQKIFINFLVVVMLDQHEIAVTNEQFENTNDKLYEKNFLPILVFTMEHCIEQLINILQSFGNKQI